jgi:hypothetical protein
MVTAGPPELTASSTLPLLTGRFVPESIASLHVTTAADALPTLTTAIASNAMQYSPQRLTVSILICSCLAMIFLELASLKPNCFNAPCL